MKTFTLFLTISVCCLLMLSLVGLQQEGTWKAPVYVDTLKNPFTGNEKAIMEGKNIYESMCWTCHGYSGKGDGPAAKGLSQFPADHTSEKVQSQSDGALFWKISKGKGQMAPYEKSLSKAQRWKVVTYIRTLSKTSSGK